MATIAAGSFFDMLLRWRMFGAVVICRLIGNIGVAVMARREGIQALQRQGQYQNESYQANCCQRFNPVD